MDVLKFLPSSSVFSAIDNNKNMATFPALLYEVSFATSSKMFADASRDWFVTFSFTPSKIFSQISKTFSTKSCP